MSWGRFATVLSALTGLFLLAAAPPPPDAQSPARFAWFDYRGDGGAPAPIGQYKNPVLAGFYPDPSILRVGPDFYLVNSTFSWFPGIPVFHSRDLVHWRQIGNAIDRPSQLDFTGAGMSRGIFAPDISYHAGRFYIVTTSIDRGGNFVITATDPRGPWSDPVWLPSVEGIDPSLFFDEDGSAWIVNNRAPPGPPRYDGHRAIWIQRFDTEKLAVTGQARLLLDGGVDPAKNPVWIEGPHIFRAFGKYYLTAAEGGTSVNHSQVILRADRVDGPYTPAPASVNPILTQRDLDPARPAPITSAGHADLVRLPNGDWWAVFLATQPYRGDLYNTGRETFLLPVTWHDGWPTILPAGQPIPRMVRKPSLPAAAEPTMPTTGSFDAFDPFDGSKLGLGWMTMRTPKVAQWQVAGGVLEMTPSQAGIGDHAQPSFIARRQQHADAVATTSMTFDPDEGAEAGIAAVQDDDYFLGIGLTQTNGEVALRAFRRASTADPAIGETIATKPIALAPGTSVRLRIAARGGKYDLGYAIGARGPWTTLARNVDGTILSTATAGGFTGTMIGPYARAPRD